jgi:hypothetical protein
MTRARVLIAPWRSTYTLAVKISSILLKGLDTYGPIHTHSLALQKPKPGIAKPGIAVIWERKERRGEEEQSRRNVSGPSKAMKPSN